MTARDVHLVVGVVPGVVLLVEVAKVETATVVATIGDNHKHNNGRFFTARFNIRDT